MTTTVTMPQLGESIAEGTIGKWLKSPGDRVERDEPIVEIITDKVNAEIPSPVAGFIQSISVREGETVAVGTELVVIGDSATASESAAHRPSVSSTVESIGQRALVAVSPPEPIASGTPSGVDLAAAVDADEDGHRRASPLVKKLAQDHRVDLNKVAGTGLGGRITKADILAFIESQGDQTKPSPAPTLPPAPAPAVPAPAATPTGSDEEVIALTPMRRAIAEHMVRSVHTSPHAWSMIEIDVSSLVQLRASLQHEWQARTGFELTYLPFFVKAVVEALRETPGLNARWAEHGIVLKRQVNIGIAVAVPGGLVVPVIHDADQKSIAGLAQAVRDLATRGRAARLNLEDMQGGTFTVNNTGALGSIASAPIINQPQAGIITMEAIVKRPTVVSNDAIAIRSVMNSCLSFDHRVTDGAEAMRFLQGVKRRVEAYGPSTAIY